MDLDFGVENYGFPTFDSFMPGNMGINWNAQAGFGGGSLLLDREKQDLPKISSSNPGKKDLSQTKNAAALRSHCEAERRRRERINAHYAALRNFVPCADKMDKATLLAEVIKQVKMLKKQASEATQGLIIPTDADEVTVEPCSDDRDVPAGFLSFRASLCCDYKPELIPEVRKGLEAFNLTLTKPEISTLGNRVKSVFFIIAQKGHIGGESRRERFARSIRDALFSILKKMSASDELLPGATYLNKRRRVSFLSDPSSSL